ncbi:hypothetical protein PMAYCL1PPCAC_27892, partial [Pristionchus mayeri]
QLSAIKSSFLCKSHFSPSDYVGNSFKLLPNAVPFCEHQSTPTKLPRNSIAESSHICSECGKKLRSKQNLNIHMRIHSGFHTCGEQFDLKTQLKQHLIAYTGHVQQASIPEQQSFPFLENAVKKDEVEDE